MGILVLYPYLARNAVLGLGFETSIALWMVAYIPLINTVQTKAHASTTTTPASTVSAVPNI